MREFMRNNESPELDLYKLPNLSTLETVDPRDLRVVYYRDAVGRKHVLDQ